MRISKKRYTKLGDFEFLHRREKYTIRRVIRDSTINNRKKRSGIDEVE